jgi:hypothetical protein
MSSMDSEDCVACALATRFNVAQPMPIRPWRGSPASKETTSAASSGVAAANAAASDAVLSFRDRVAATAADVCTTVDSGSDFTRAA